MRRQSLTVPVSDSAAFAGERPNIDWHWSKFLQLMSWWDGESVDKDDFQIDVSKREKRAIKIKWD